MTLSRKRKENARDFLRPRRRRPRGPVSLQRLGYDLVDGESAFD